MRDSNSFGDDRIDYYDIMKSENTFMSKLCNYLNISKFTRVEVGIMVDQLGDNNYFNMLVYSVKFKELKYMLDELYLMIYIINNESMDDKLGKTIKTKYTLEFDDELIELIKCMINIIINRKSEYEIKISFPEITNTPKRMIMYTISKKEE